METYSIGRRSGGNLYENWHHSDYPDTLSSWQKSYLEKMSLPAYKASRVQTENGTLHISCNVAPHDVILIRLQEDSSK